MPPKITTPTAVLTLLLALLTHVHANLYPTNPVTNTTFYAGQPANLTWTDDAQSPALRDVGPVDVVLFAGEHNVTLLASNIDPTLQAYDVRMPNLTYLGDEPIYALHFLPKSPSSKTIYTARFRILPPTPDMLDTTSSSKSPANTEENAKDEHSNSLLTLVLPSTTLVSTLLPHSAPSPAPSVSSTFIDANAVQTMLSSQQQQSHEEQSTSKSAGSANFGWHAYDAEKLKFRLVYLFWPVMVGLSMSF